MVDGVAEALLKTGAATTYRVCGVLVAVPAALVTCTRTGRSLEYAVAEVRLCEELVPQFLHTPLTSYCH